MMLGFSGGSSSRGDIRPEEEGCRSDSMPGSPQGHLNDEEKGHPLRGYHQQTEDHRCMELRTEEEELQDRGHPEREDVPQEELHHADVGERMDRGEPCSERKMGGHQTG